MTTDQIDHRKQLWRLWERAQAKREHEVSANGIYETYEPEQAVAMDIAIERDALKPVAKHCQAHGLSFKSLAMFVDPNRNHGADALMGIDQYA